MIIKKKILLNQHSWSSGLIEDQAISGEFKFHIKITKHETEKPILEMMIGIMNPKKKDIDKTPDSCGGIAWASSIKPGSGSFYPSSFVKTDGTNYYQGFTLNDEIIMYGNTKKNQLGFIKNGVDFGLLKFQNFKIPSPCYFAVSSGNYAILTEFTIFEPNHFKFKNLFEKSSFDLYFSFKD